MIPRLFRRGSALIHCILVLVVLSVMAVGLATLSGAHLEIANHQQKANQAFANTESGLEVSRYWLSRVRVSSSTLPAQYFSTIISSVQGDLAAHSISNFLVNANAVIKGTLISYSPDPTVVQGNIAMDFDRAAMVEIPAGFDLYRVLVYNPASYTMAY